jgi:two-component system cell cycle sensor histidine kinase/response regulator CckA
MGDKGESESNLREENARLKARVRELSAVESKLKETIKELRESRELYGALVRTAPMAVTVTDLEGRITHVSDMTLKLHGFDSPEEMLGMVSHDLIVPGERDRVLENVSRTMEQGSISEVVYTMLRRDGSTFIGELSASVVRDADGVPCAFVGATRDITRRREIENALRASEEKYRDLVENINDAIYTIDADGILTYVSPAIESMVGYAPSELIGTRALLEFVEPHDLQRALSGFKRVMDGRLRPNYIRVRTRSGDLRWLRASSRPILEEGRSVGIQGVLADVTDHMKAEQQASFLGSITQRLRDAVIVTDADFNITYVNSAAEALFGYKAEELRGKRPELLSAEPRISEIIEDIVRTARVGGVWDGTVLSIRKDGTTFVGELRVSSLRDRRGEVSHFVGIQRDVTDKRRLEQELLQAQKMEAVGKMAGGIAHDFNNALTAIIGYSELLAADCESGSAMKRDVEEVGKTARRAAGLTRQLLSFSRRQVMQVAPVNLTDLVGGLEVMLRRVISEEVELAFELSPDVKSVEADSGQIEQVVVNLVLNARDAMEHGGRLVVRTKNVRVDESSLRGKVKALQSEWVLLQVLDSGSGMDPNVMEHVFEPFYTTKDPGKGSGLGLFVAFGVVTRHGGWIDVSSSPGRGSAFSVYLPAVSKSSVPGDDERDEELNAIGNGEMVLLVEDQDDVRRIAERALVDGGFVVIAAASAAEAMDLYRAQGGKVDLVFSDLVLSDDSGLDLAENLRSLNPELPILLTSGCADKDPQWPTIEDLGYSFLEKPYDPADLVGAVWKILHLSNAREV